MILFANFLLGVSRILHIILMVSVWALVIRAVLSWVHIPSLYSFHVILYRLTEPVLRPVRRFVPPGKLGGVDVSPLIVVLAILFVDVFLVNSLALYARRLLSVLP